MGIASGDPTHVCAGCRRAWAVPPLLPQRGGWARGQADSVTSAARPAWSNVRRLTPGVFWGCCVLIETLLKIHVPLPLSLQSPRPISPHSGRETACPGLGTTGHRLVNSIYLTPSSKLVSTTSCLEWRSRTLQHATCPACQAAPGCPELFVTTPSALQGLGRSAACPHCQTARPRYWGARPVTALMARCA